jgi:hypothetical protein
MTDGKTLDLAQAAMMINNSVCEQIAAHEYEVAVITILAKNDDSGGLRLALSANTDNKGAAVILKQALQSIEKGHFYEAEIVEP